MKSDSKKKKIIIGSAVAFCAILIAFFVILDAVANNREYTASSVSMGAVVSQKIYGKNSDKISSEIFSRIDNIESKEISWRMASSEISKLNKNKQVKLSDKTTAYLKNVLDVCKHSSGAIDISIGKLSQLWNIGEVNFDVPKKEEILNALSSVNYKKISLNGNTASVEKNQLIDLGAVGKGIACDEAKIILEKSSAHGAIISVGGSILLWGKSNNSDGLYSVGIRNPLGEATDFMAVMKLGDCFISTSGNYEKVSTANGKKYHHILSTQTGYPIENDLLSVTVVCQSGLQSDALSTACYALGYDKSLSLLKKYEAEAVFIFKDKTVKATDGIKSSLEIKNNGFSLV